MPASDAADASNPALKEMFNEARYRALAETVGAAYPAFDRKRFLNRTLDGLADRSLLQRMRRTSEALHEALPQDYPKALTVLRKVAPQIRHNFVSIVLPDFVALYGRKHYELSIDALKFFTQFGSSEFAIREYLRDDLQRTLAIMATWADDENEHVRRLASEGSRPRLPWSFRLDAIVKDPELTQPILRKLLKDPSLYVRKSVANHLNDISKDHPQWLVSWLAEQELTHPHTQWIAKRALRTLIKKGAPEALALIGVSGKAALGAVSFVVSPKRVVLGERVTLRLGLQAAGRAPQRVVIDFAIHFVKSSGAAAAKVFKWKELTLEPAASLKLEKSQRIQDFTTRKHYPGRHKVVLLVNGHEVAESVFVLE